ncbi:unnamed protein product, partial [Sphacelaria rigidula]
MLASAQKSAQPARAATVFTGAGLMPGAASDACKNTSIDSLGPIDDGTKSFSGGSCEEFPLPAAKVQHMKDSSMAPISSNTGDRDEWINLGDERAAETRLEVGRKVAVRGRINNEHGMTIAENVLGPQGAENIGRASQPPESLRRSGHEKTASTIAPSHAIVTAAGVGIEDEINGDTDLITREVTGVLVEEPEQHIATESARFNLLEGAPVTVGELDQQQQLSDDTCGGRAQIPTTGPPSAERTAPAAWFAPAPDALGIGRGGGSVAPTEVGEKNFSRILNLGDGEWASVPLANTPPFDALNNPNQALLGSTSVVGMKSRPRAAAATTVAGPSVGVGVAEGSEWMNFFAPAHRLAPAGDAYTGDDTFRSADASASSTARADSKESFVSCSSGARASDDIATACRRDISWTRKSLDISHDGCSSLRFLGEVQNPAHEAQRRMIQNGSYFPVGVGCGSTYNHGDNGEGEDLSWLRKTRCRREGEGERRWNLAAERSRQYIRGWEAFLIHVERYFDGEAQVRKRLSTIRRAHPTVSNEVAFVALAQSRGKASEAAAVLQRSRIKDEATMVATMLDVTSFIDLACKVAERRRFYRLAEEEKTQRQQRQNRRSRCCRLPLSPQYHHQQSELRELRGDLQAYHQFHQHQHHHGCSGDHCDNVRRSDSTTSADSNLTQEEREDQRFKVEPFDSGADFIGAVEIRGDSRSNRAGDDEYGGEKQSTSRENHSRTTARGSRGPTGSPVPPAVLPPLVGLADGSDTPPTPNTLKTILATSTSVAVAIPSGLGLA